MKTDWIGALLSMWGVSWMVALVLVVRDVLTGNFEGADE